MRNRLDRAKDVSHKMDTLCVEINELKSSCEARSIAQNDFLFQEMGQVLGSLTDFLRELDTALLINARQCDEETGT